MRKAAVIIAVLLVATLGGRAALAHVDIDTLGTPDPFFEDDVGGSSNGTARSPADGVASTAPAVHPQLLRAYLYGMGGLLAIFVVLLFRSLRISRERFGS